MTADEQEVANANLPFIGRLKALISNTLSRFGQDGEIQCGQSGVAHLARVETGYGELAAHLSRIRLRSTSP